LQQFRADIGCITESWFNDNISDAYINITGFLLYRRDRIKRKGGGVCIYVSTLLQSCLYYSSNDFEVIWAKICCHGDCYFVASCYHPPKPKYSVDDFVAQLSSTIEDVIDREVNPIFLITGDFNLLCTEFLEEKFGFDQLVQTSTHGNNILDKVFTNRPDLFQTTVHHSLLKTEN